MNELFDIKDKVAVITGGYGALGSSVAEYMASQGVKTVIADRNEKGCELADKLVDRGYDAVFTAMDVLDIQRMRQNKADILARYGKIDILINIAGGNMPAGTVNPGASFFDIDVEGWNKVTDLNLHGTVYPCIVFGEAMAARKEGCIINISSMAAYSAITRVPGYSAAKAAVTNFTYWLATETARQYGDKVRVNAIAPGFFIGNQNRALLLNPDGSLTDRSVKVIAKTPMGRFGDISELNGTIHFLCSRAASFITGALIPVDGGFSAFSGV